MNIIPKSWFHRVIDELYKQVARRDDYAIKAIHMEILIGDEFDDGEFIRGTAILTASNSRDYFAEIVCRVK